ncbi:gastrula zinc finger protein XlCGF8.2DB-like isoform X2 [Leguminivora glycinivorella]|uniref:gastrula zinc finger protein XlCGF8.2DB-like isoform X2 n=1 Tax=Leguminivora glycinivorella TaxID=1035111 RepID=UPI0020103EB4|nr:gastrula zinc finger protein XlCGF8.2DB-like isoform X2 [Leguminivora glycinivorella]
METRAESGSMSPARVKLEPETDQSEMAPVKEEAVFLDEEERVKEEWSGSTAGRGVSEAAMLADLYIEHEVKDELVLGPERPHRPVVAPAALSNRVAASAEPAHTPSAIATVYQCHHCSQLFWDKSAVEKHVHTHSPLHDSTAGDYNTKRHDDLHNHPRTHTDDKPFWCSQCDYKCKQKSNLQSHLITHTDERPFSCSHCDYKSKTKGDLQKHLMTHTNEKPFSCGHCDYKGRRKADVKSHLRTHTDEKPFGCGQCDYKCKRKEELQRHFRTHTGEKPLYCNYCYYKCRTKDRIKSHLMTHTDDKPFSCSQCDYKCRRKSLLKAHMMTHTGEKHNYGSTC